MCFGTCSVCLNSIYRNVWVTLMSQVIAGIVDAAYSGDWSRIGVINKGKVVVDFPGCNMCNVTVCLEGNSCVQALSIA